MIYLVAALFLVILKMEGIIAWAWWIVWSPVWIALPLDIMFGRGKE